MVGILNYGVGNVRAFQNLLLNNQVEVKMISNKSELSGVTKLVLPGVGSFDQAMNLFNKSGLRDDVEKMVLEMNVPIMGICVGMQMLADRSEEGIEKGLGWVKGLVKKFDKESISVRFKLPHMGWNEVKFIKNNAVINDIGNPARFYFLHSYYFLPDNEDDIIGVTEYGKEYASMVMKGNILGIQFHPEKSHECGRRILVNFSKL